MENNDIIPYKYYHTTIAIYPIINSIITLYIQKQSLNEINQCEYYISVYYIYYIFLNSRPLKMENLEELRDVCAQSRLWAGLHYTASVSAGIETCSGLGQLAFDFIKLMKNNATYAAAGGPWYKNDTLGVCPP